MERDKLLICDDEEATRKSLELILSEKYELLFARNCDEALDILNNTPDVKAALLDIKMPKLNGIEALKNIKGHNKDLPVIIVTGYQSVEAAAEAIKFGAINYIAKPLDSKIVIDTVEKTLS